MHPKTITTTKELTKLVLALLGGGAIIMIGMGNNPRTAAKWPAALAKYSTFRIRETLRRLRLQGYIRYQVRDLSTPIVLTKRGMTRMARLTFRDLLKGKKKWDYLWRIVMFDIPEKKRHLRELLRRELFSAGFYPLQKSIFVCPFPCETEIQNLCKRIRTHRHIIFATTASLGKDEEKARRFFFEK